jgi:hypothetical protein
MFNLNLLGRLSVMALVPMMGLTACLKKESIVEKNSQTVSVNEKMTSDELAESAEQLVGPYTFMLAYKTAKVALEKDPANLKAEFYLKLLKRFEAFRGAFVRIKPILSPEELARHEENIRQFPNSPLKTFLLDSSKPEFRKHSDVQAVLGEYFTAVSDFWKFLKDNQTASLELHLNPHVFEQKIKEDLADSCQYVENPDGYKVICKYNMIATKKLNTADLISLRQMASGELLYSFFNSYSLAGLEKLSQFDPQGQKSSKEKVEFLTSIPEFGKLNSYQTLSLFRMLGSDATAATKWALQYHNDICPSGQSKKNQRSGYLFDEGICIEDRTGAQNFIALMERALGGVTELEGRNKENGSPRKIRVNLFAWSESPIQDLRQVKPNQWNECGQATSLNDNTLGGIFVDRDFNSLLLTDCP